MGKAEAEGRTEKPTEKKLKEARERGRIPKSQELVSWFSIFAATTIIERTFFKGNRALHEQLNVMGELIATPDMNRSLSYFVESIRDGFLLILPLSASFAALAIIGFGAQTRFRIAKKAIKPNFKKLNPLPGIKRLFQKQNLQQAIKQAGKMIIVGGLAYLTIWQTGKGLIEGGPYPMSQLMVVTGKAIISFMKNVAMLLIVLGILDYFMQRKQTMEGLMMKKQEVKDESKNQELPPEVKMRIRQKQRQLSRNRMLAAINDADAVIVNPVHVAVALKYDPEKGAPKVVAKGAGFVAEKIRERAEEERVPLIQDIPLARALHANCELDDEIPLEFFEAVARVLAFVYGLRRRGFATGLHVMPGSPDMAEADRMESEELARTGKSLAARARQKRMEEARKARKSNIAQTIKVR